MGIIKEIARVFAIGVVGGACLSPILFLPACVTATVGGIGYNNYKAQLAELRENYSMTEEFQAQQEYDINQNALELQDSKITADEFASRSEYLKSDNYIDSSISKNEQYKDEFERLNKGMAKYKPVMDVGLSVALTTFALSMLVVGTGVGPKIFEDLLESGGELGGDE